MNETEVERTLAECLEDYHRRRALGESPAAQDYHERAGVAYREFVNLLAAESALDDALTLPVEPPFPQTFGEYTLTGELGRGAMGVVYEAVHRKLGRKVALKVLRTGFTTESTARERFNREAKACAQLRHDNIVPIYDAGDVDGSPYYSMQILEGKTLHELAADGGMEDRQALFRGLAGVADALQALHDAGIVHRDVKPSNIVVQPGGRMILADFGLARTAQSEKLTATGQALGTPLYMSPEQVLGKSKEIDGQADVYGLGATAYEALTGMGLFESDDTVAILRMILHERPRPPREIRPDIPVACEQVVMKAVEKEKADRYATAAQMRDDLLNYAEGRDVTGRPVSALQRGLRQLRKHSLLIAAALVVAVVAGYLYLQRPVMLTIRGYPVAEAIVDGVSYGNTETTVRLHPGTHEVTLRRKGFEDLTETVELRSGMDRDIALVLPPKDPRDTDALSALAESFAVQTRPFDEPERKRGGSSDSVEPVFPRGFVSTQDLRTFRIDVGAAFEEIGKLRFMRGTDVLLEEDFDPEDLSTEAEIPATVLAAVADGGTFTWGFYPEEGDPTTSEFTVEPDLSDELQAKLDEMARKLAKHPVALRHLRAQVFLNHGHYTAAYQEAKGLVDEAPGDARATAIMQQALDGLGLENTMAWRDALKALDRMPVSERRKVYRKND